VALRRPPQLRALGVDPIIADNLSKAGWSWGCVATVDREGRTIFVADAHRDNGKRFVGCGEEKLAAFIELESVIQGLKSKGRG
jgi:hypothetical protein